MVSFASTMAFLAGTVAVLSAPTQILLPTDDPVIKTSSGPLLNLKSVMASFRAKLDGIDISKLSLHEQAPLYCNLCVSFGNITQALKTLKKDTFFAIDGVIKLLSNEGTISSYAEGMSFLSQNQFVEPVASNAETVITKLLEITNFSKTALSPREHRKAISAWFHALVSNKNVVEDLQIDTDILAKILISAPQYINAVGSTGDYISRILLNIGVLRMPDSVETNFLIYNLKVNVTASTERVWQFQYNEKAQLHGKFTWHRFIPSQSIFNSLPDKIQSKAVADGRKFYENSK